MSTNDISTAETAKSDQYYHYYNKQQQQLELHQRLNHHRTKHTMDAATHHSTRNNNSANNWQKENSADMLAQHSQCHEDHHFYYQQQTNALAKSNNMMCNNVPTRTYITPIDIPTPPPQPLTASSNSIVSNFHGKSAAINSNSIGNKRIQRLQHNNIGCQQQHQQHQHQQQQHQRLCHCKHNAILDLAQQPTATKATIISSNNVNSIPKGTLSSQQSPQLHQRSALSMIHDSVIPHDFFESNLTPPPPPIGHIPHAQQQQLQQQQQPQQQQQQQQHQSQLSNQYRKNHRTHQHYRSQDHLQHLLPLNIVSKGSGTLTGAASGIDVDGRRFKNLVYSQKKIRRIRWILSVVFGILCLAALGVGLYFIIRSSDEDSGTNLPNTGDNSIELDDVLSGHLAAKRFNASWSTGSNLLFKEASAFRNLQAIVEYDVKTRKRQILLYDEAQQYVLFEKSADGQFLLLAKKFKKNFRHSFEAEYDIYNLTSKQIQPLLINGEQRFILMAQWAPVGNALILNFERNLYYKPHAFADEIAITNDETPGILNGVPDWVYEEEVFSSNTATWFNADGTMIAFIRFDDTPTSVINFPYYGEAGDLRYQYPYNRLVAYPKAGSSNPHVKLFTANLTRAAKGLDVLTEIPRPSELNTETDDIITVVHWLDKQNVLSVWMNRIQNLAYLQVFDGVKRSVIYSMESKTGWVDFFSAPFHNRDGSRIAVILPQAQDNDGPYRHLCTLPTSGSNVQPETLTKGKFVVQSILHWDQNSDVIFFTANTAQNAEVLHVYAIKASAGQSAKCLTCKLHKSGDVEQSYYAATFNADRQVIISSLGPSAPMHVIYEWSWASNQITLTKLIDWESNVHLREKLQNMAMPIMEIHTVPIDGGFTAKVLLQLPPNLDRSGKTKYPMLVDVYGGPDSYSVVDKWILDWGTYLSSNQSVIYAKIDGRGSGLRGDKLLHSVYLKLGTVEISDQIEVTKYLQGKFNFIDAKHTGIWGWSYGGYAAAMALANDNSSVFSCAASIAPVTDWAYYDSIYTERYMSLPKYNEVGYANGRLSTRAQKLRGKKFLLVHGTLDDNVHYQQAMILAKNLERYDILFKQISYPDEDHGLSGVRPHLYHSLDRFFGECFASKRLMSTK